MRRRIVTAFVVEGDPDRLTGGSLYHRRLADLAPEQGCEVRFVSVPQRTFPLALVDGPRVLRAAKADADVVMVDSLASNTLGPWMALGVGGGVPLVGSIHQNLGGIDTGRVRRSVQARFDRMAWRRCRRLVVASELLAAQLVAHGIPFDAMAVVPPGRDVAAASRTAPTSDELRRGRRAAVLCVGNWLPRKGILEVLDAVAALDEPLVTLHLVGDEAVDEQYRRRVLSRLHRPDLSDRVVRHGMVHPNEMGGLYEASDVFVLASTVEPYGTVYGEAMAFGLPVVGWREGNLPHLIDDGVEGRAIATGEVDGLACALAELASDGQRRTRMGAAARARAEGLPTWRETAERFFAVCREAAERR